MNEQQWFECPHPDKMQEFMEKTADVRKFRLFACACCRRIWDQLNPKARKTVELAELFSDLMATYEELEESANEMWRDYYEWQEQVLNRGWPSIPDWELVLLPILVRHDNLSNWKAEVDNEAHSSCAPYSPEELREVFATEWPIGAVQRAASPKMKRVYYCPPIRSGVMYAYSKAMKAKVGLPADDATDWLVKRRHEEKQQTALLRDIFGNPFRPVTINPSWLTPTVTALAQTIYDHRRFDDMPILADALEEAGCTNEDILQHCRSGGEHVRGCWVVDLLLGKG